MTGIGLASSGDGELTPTGASPLVSVVTATYNWSSALACAIESAMLQTFRDFEMVVIGDGCTDDSERVVASFKNPRLIWRNLPIRSGNQVAPNNYGISLCASPYVAYLGHDDIWHPSHLESLVETAQRTGADLTSGVTILYGPRGSGVRGICGVTEDGSFRRNDFMVPSSILHKRSLLTRIGLWRGPSDSRLPPDYDLLRRAYDAGSTFAFTGQVSTFKFNAAWRRNCYLLKDASEQKEMLARVQAEPDFRERELIEVVRSTLSGRYIRIQTPEPELRSNVEIMGYNADFKGSGEKQEMISLAGPAQFALTGLLAGFEWHELEQREEGSFRWSGPSLLSSVSVPVRCTGAMQLSISIRNHFQSQLATDLEIIVNGSNMPFTVLDGSLVQTTIPPNFASATSANLPLTIALRVKRTNRPSDLGLSEDNRSLGVAVSWIELLPQ